jgi:hypothetical protein
MSTQLRLMKNPPGPKPARAKAGPKVARGSTSRSTTSRGRRVHWDSDWRLSASRRQIGLEGVAAARDALARADRPPDLRRDEELSEAS